LTPIEGDSHACDLGLKLRSGARSREMGSVRTAMHLARDAAPSPRLAYDSGVRCFALMRLFPLLLGTIACSAATSRALGTSDRSGGAGSGPARNTNAAAAGGRAALDAGGAGSARDAGERRAPNDGAADAMPKANATASSDPATCAASDEGNVALGKDVFVADTGKQAVAALTYTSVGASGAYAEVVTGWSKATGCVGDSNGSLCKATYRKPKQVSGALAPFDEEMTLVFAGPIELYQLAVYRPGSDGWERNAYWDRCVTDGLVFAGNKSWYECGGFVESYVTADGSAKSDVPVQFSGTIAAGTEVNVMSSALCSGATADSDCGWSSGLPLHGFGGDATGSKIFAVKLRMPLGTKTPAYWILPSQVIRSSQYGCNCRGAGSDPTYKGGCGELDVAEVLGGVTTSLEATTTLYSFQDITGGGSVAFNRPVNEAAVFVVIFDAKSAQIAIRRLGATELDFAATLPAETVARLLSDSGTLRMLQ
jgi:hypothetical protein